MAVLFGTDGVRGVANRELTPELAYTLGRCGAYVLLRECRAQRPRVLVGRDTRVSGQMLEAALTAGLTSMGLMWSSWGYCRLPELHTSPGLGRQMPGHDFCLPQPP